MIYCSHVAHALQVSRGASSDFHVHTPDVQKTQSRIDWNWGGRVVGLSRWSSVQLPMLTGQKQSKRQSALQLMKICCTHNSYRLTWSASRQLHSSHYTTYISSSPISTTNFSLNGKFLLLAPTKTSYSPC